jgi:hypothetical protein
MRIAILTAVSAASLAAAACAPTPGVSDGASRQCMFVSQVRSFSSGSEESVIVRAGREAYELTAVGFCAEIDWANEVVIDTLGGGSSLCVGDHADLIVRPLGGPAERCRVRVSRALTDAEVEAL